MPYVNIQVTDEGVTRDQKRDLIERATQMLVDVLGKDPATTFVVVEEVSTDNWGVAGQSVTDRRR
ncbi:MAG: 4-oxalocrotonate tautomerase family protein [Pseudomonadales bacterium]|jgi:4-oxalocrotonate tautomerase